MLKKLLARLGAYSIGVVVTLLVGLFSVPALIHLVGPQTWAGLAIVQSVAALVAVAVGLGWPATGPSWVASLQPEERPQYFLRSIYARAAVALLAAPIGAGAAVALTDLPPAVAIVGTVAYSASALGGSWYFIGEARPARLLLTETLPRAVGILLGLAGVAITGRLEAFVITLLLCSVAGIAAAYAVILKAHGPMQTKPSWACLFDSIRSQKHGLMTTGTAAVYVNSPMLIAGMILTNGLAEFAIAYRMFGYLVAGFQPFVQFAQGWIPETGPLHTPTRAKTAARFALLASLFVALLTAGLLPLGASILSVSTISLPWAIAIPIGLCTGAVTVSQVVGLACLPPLNGQAFLARSTIVGALVGAVLLAILGWALGAPGLALAMTGSETLVSTLQLTWLRGLLRRRSVSRSTHESESSP